MANILLIEPNTILARTYSRALEHVGYVVVRAADAQGAIFAADEHQPDVVVLELQLGAHDGIEFLHEFRSYAEWQDIPVVLHSSVLPTQLAGAQFALEELGVRTALYKPRTSLQKLISTVNHQIVTA